jgi:hypothetical protein
MQKLVVHLVTEALCLLQWGWYVTLTPPKPEYFVKEAKARTSVL